MNTIRLITDKDVIALLDMKNTLQCVENAYRQKANKQSYILPVVSADLIQGKADMDIKSGVYPSGNIYGLKLVSWFGDNEAKHDPFVKETLLAAFKYLPEIVVSIEPHLREGYTFSRLGYCEQAILTLGATEMKLGNPKPVVINTCVKLAKQYCDDNVYKFINAILEKI